MRFTPLSIPEVRRIDLEPIQDNRGSFSRLFCKTEMREQAMETEIVQSNHSLTNTIGSIRGLHFQRPPSHEAKWIRCLAGAVFDVAVDLRFGSATFGQWCGLELTAENRTMIYIPPGFAHGFQTLAENTEMLYFHSHAYAKQHEGGVNPFDPEIGVDWPLPISVVSKKDQGLPAITEIEAIEL